MVAEAVEPGPRARGRTWWASLAGWVLIQGLLVLLGPWRPVFVPLLYVWVHLTAGLAGPGPTLTVLGLSVAVEGARAAWALDPWVQVFVRWGMLLLFASTAAGVLRLEVLRLRRRERAELEQRRRRMDQEARDFRLVTSLLASPASERSEADRSRIRQEGSVAALRQAIHTLLLMVRQATGADAVRVFVQGEDGRVEAKGAVPELPAGAPARVAPSGAVGAVLKTDRPIHLRPARSGAGLGYPSSAAAFVGVPIRLHRWVVGVLVAERSRDAPFDEGSETVLGHAAEHLTHMVELERLLATMDRLKFEQERFLEAFNLLAEARTIEQASERLLEAARRVADQELAAVVLVEPGSDSLRVAALHAPEDLGPKLEGAAVPHDGQNLVSSAVRLGQTLPVAPVPEGAESPAARVFGPAWPVPLRSVKVVPIRHRTESIGALVLGTRKRARELDRDAVRILEAVAAQSAMSVVNAHLFEEVQRRATTDGLTGLVNHRRFQELLEEALARSHRFRRPVSVLMIDADHFKSINDTFGHPVGDLVLRRIAERLTAEARQTDVVARYGGEEFVMILEGTDADGARAMGDRIRERLQAERIEGEFGKLSVTVSVGGAVSRQTESGPAAADRADLLERADRALYRAKQRGRNRVELAEDPRCVPGSASASRDSGRPS